MKQPDITDKNHPLNVFKSIGKYNHETGYTPHLAGYKIPNPIIEEVVYSKESGCNSCGGGKVR